MQKPHLLTSSWRRLSSAFLAFLIVLAMVPVTIPIAFAATVTWDGDGGDSVWSTCTNWSGNSCPGSGDDALIDTAVTVKLTAATTINSLTLGVSAGNVASVLSFDYDAIGGSPLTVNGNVTMYGSSKVTHTDNTTATSYRANLDINGSLTLNSNASIDVKAKGFTGGATDTSGNGTSPGTNNTYAGGGGAHAGTGGRSACSSSNNGGASPYGSSKNPITLGSGGAGGTDAGAVGGDGGGAVKVDVAGTFTLNGTVSADGANGSASGTNTNAGGGGAGGSVQIIAGTLSGSGTVEADGGNGGNGAHRDGGGGGAGRILVGYTTTTISTSSFNTMGSALGGSVDTTFSQCGSPLPVVGQNGSAIILDLASDVTNFTDADAYIIDGYRFESGEENGTTPTRFRYNNLTILGTGTSGTGLVALRSNSSTSIIDADGTATWSNIDWTCSSVTTFQTDAATLVWNNATSDDVFNLTSCGTWTLNVTSSITATLDNLTISMTAIDWNVPASSTITLSDSTITTTAKTKTAFTIDDAITLNLGTANNTNNSTVTSNATLSISAMTVYAGSTWSSNALGCAAGSGGTAASGPDGSNVCATSTTGYGRDGTYAGGGGGHGGAGGASVDGTASSTYDTATDPTTYRLGSGGARGESVAGGVGGGYVKLDVSGTLTLNGTITANGGVGVANTNNGGGGGSGGSVYILTTTLAGGSGGNVTAKGGVGGDAGGGGRGGGGGGGGLIYLSYGSDSSSWRSGLTSGNTTTGGTGGTGGIGAGTAGSAGTLTQADVPVFSSALYKDSDANGVVDQVVITFDESVSIGGTVASTRFTWTSASGANGFAGTLSGNASASGTDVTITIDSTEANETGATTIPTIAWNDNGDDATNKIQDADGNIVQTFTAQNVSDGAKPAVITKQYQDVDANGTVERVLMTLSENASTQTAVLGDFAYVANDITGSALSGGTLAYPASNQVGLLLGTAGNANITGHTTAPTLAYTDGGATAIADAAGNQLATFAAANLSDGAAPIVTTRQYEDSDGNGTVERLNLTLSEAASTQTAVLGDFAYTAGSITGSALSGGTLSYPSSTAMRIVFGTAGNSGITSHSTAPTIAYTDGGSTAVADAAGNQLPTFSAITLSDAAAPAFVSARTTSTTNVRLTMSEAVSSATFGAAGGWTATGLTPSAVVINSDTTKLDLTVSAVNQGYTASNFAFTSGVSGSAISDAASNATASFTAKTVADGLAPDAPGSFTRSTGSGTTATFTWTATSDTNFNHYEIWYGTNSTDVTNRNGTASEWDNDPNDATLTTRTTTTTTVTGLTAGSTYYALICAVDNASNEACSSSVSFVTNQAPTVATVTGSQATDGIGTVTISFVMDDPDDDNTLQALVEYSTNGGTSWSKATLSTTNADTTATYGTPRVDNSATYQVGKASNYITSSSGANTVTVKWQSRTDAPTANVANAKIRVTPYDGVVAGTAASSSNFVLDNVAPASLASLAKSSATSTTLVLGWTAATDTNFDHYEIWYGTTANDVTNRTGTATEWDNDNDADLATAATADTTLTGLTEGGTYSVKIWAVDDFGNATTPSAISAATNSKATAASVTGSQATDGSGKVTVNFIMDDANDSAILQAKVEYSTDNGSTWAKATLSEVAIDITATAGTPDVENDNTYQVGNSDGYITSASGANTVNATWNSKTDVPTADTITAKLRITPYDGIEAGTAATSSNFTLDNVASSAPVVSSGATVLGAGATWDTTITGTKDANTSIKNNGTQVVASNSSTTWSYNVVLVPGNNVYSFTAVDANGNASTAASHTIVYTQGQGGSGGGTGGSTSSGSSGTSTTTATTTATVTTPSTTSTTTTSGEAEVKPVPSTVPAVPGETDSEEEDEDEDEREEIKPITVTPIATPVVTPVVPGPKPIVNQTKQAYPLAPQTPAAPSVKPPVATTPDQIPIKLPELPSLSDISFSPTGILSQLQEQLKQAGIEPTAPSEAQPEAKPTLIPELKPSTIEFFQPDPVKAQQKVEATIQFLAEFNSALTEMFVAQMQPNLPGLPNSAPSTSLSLGGLLLPSAPEAPVVVAQTSAPVLPVTRLDLYVDQTVSREYQRIVENTDEDILPDWWEKRYGGGDTAIMNERTDLDGDGVDDLSEFMLGTDPTSADSDGDGVSDKDEIKRGTNATSWDTDGDGVSDSAELARGTDPRKFDKVEVKGDKDGDGVPDDWTKKNDKVNKEVKFTFAMTDSDNDGLTDADELKNGTDPNVRDSDGDGVSDGAEVHDYRTNPTAATSTKELEKTQLSNVKNNRAVFSDAKPVLRGTSKPNSKVTLVFMPTREQPKTLGQLLFAAAVNSTMGGLITKEVETDSQGKFLVQPKLKDGTYSVIVRSSDAEGNPTEESLPYQIHIATELVKKALVSLSRLDNVLVDLKSSRRITLDNREPVLYGKMDKAGKGYELVALWKSDLQTVSMVVDNEDGEFVISPSEPLEDGDHNLYVYAQDPATSVQTAAVSLDFRILAEQDYVAVNKRFNWIWNVLAFFAAGAVFSWGARRLRRARRSA